jgi:carbamoyltransferase
MYILGLGGSVHDYSACLVQDDDIIFAIAEERLTRHKHAIGDNLLFEHARKYCTDAARISLDSVAAVVATDILAPIAYHGCRKKTQLINHHLAHAASAFFPSGFEEAAILVVDGAGSVVETLAGTEYVETTSYYFGHRGKLSCLNRVIGRRFEGSERTENSLGEFYGYASELLGFDALDAGKTMGLAGWGTTRYVDELRGLIIHDERGQIAISRASFRRLAQFVHRVLDDGAGDQIVFQKKADIATAVQVILEEALQHCIDHLRALTGTDALCVAGGVGLNSVANSKMLHCGKFSRIFIQPAAGDDGTAIGCALQGVRMLKGNHQGTIRPMSVYTGRAYSVQEIQNALEAHSQLLEWNEDAHLIEYAACLLADGAVIGWFQGGSEFGPRALGARSILADPRDKGMKDHLNGVIKEREWFRPFAPAVPLECLAIYFDIPVPSPHMLLVAAVREGFRDTLPAITHVDGTARVQSVAASDNPLFHQLLHAFGRITGVPVLLNTSFNGRSEPIVETPADALECFLAHSIDYLVLGPFLVRRRSTSAADTAARVSRGAHQPPVGASTRAHEDRWLFAESELGRISDDQ